jgi:hypothetical protein
MSSKQSLPDFLAKKNVRFALAAICGFFAAGSLYQLLTGVSNADWLRGGGGLLLWGGWALINALHPFGKTVPGVKAAINVGLLLVVASWIARA